MSKKVRLIRFTKWVAVLLSVFALVTIIFPFASETLLDGTVVSYPTWIAVFGGTYSFSDLTHDYAIEFHLNIYLLVTYQLAGLSCLAFFLSGRKKTNLIFALVMAFISMISTIFMPYVVRFATPGFSLENVQVGYGPMLGTAALLLTQIIALFHILTDERFNR
ncbi:MAG: hypothetical protein GX816_01335 [Erysipelotrichia bacterium]|nr:hypothetical protein [Erysipelotrichia bacterium]